MFFISSVKCHSVTSMYRIGQLSKPFNDELIEPLKQGKAYPAESDGTHKLHLAARDNDVEVISHFIESGYELDVEDTSGATPLVTAVLHGNYRAAAMLHNARVDLFARQLYGQSATLIPWSFTQRAMIRLTADVVGKLRAQGFSADRTGDALAKVSCCLDEVVRLHDPALTKAFLESDCSANYGENQTIFRIVIPRFDVRHVRVLLHHGSQLDSRRLEFFRVLMDNIVNYRASPAGRAFLAELFSWSVLDEGTLEYLELALNRASAESLKVFLQYGYRAVAKAKCGRDVLASIYGNPRARCVLFLKSDEVDVDGRGYEAKTPLHFAAENGVAENVRFLLDRAADPDAADESGATPLMQALAKLNRCRRDADDDDDDDDATYCAQLLLQSRANPLLQNHAGETIFDLANAVFRQHLALAKLAVGQLAVHEALGAPVEPRLAALVNLHDQKLKRHYEECRQQLRQLMLREIRQTDGDARCKGLTMFQILTEREEKLARHVSDDDSQTIASFMKKYSKKKMHYHESLKRRIGIVEKLRVCRHRAIDVVSECTQMFDPHHLFVDHIVNYLNARDLLKFQ